MVNLECATSIKFSISTPIQMNTARPLIYTPSLQTSATPPPPLVFTDAIKLAAEIITNCDHPNTPYRLDRRAIECRPLAPSSHVSRGPNALYAARRIRQGQTLFCENPLLASTNVNCVVECANDKCPHTDVEVALREWHLLMEPRSNETTESTSYQARVCSAVPRSLESFAFIRMLVAGIDTHIRTPLLRFMRRARVDTRIGKIFAMSDELNEDDVAHHLTLFGTNASGMAVLSYLCRFYAFDISPFTSGNVSLGLALYEQMTLALNHSCEPNATWTIVGPSNTFVLMASREIEAGEEITVSYCGTTLLEIECHRERNARLYMLFDFHCYCERCCREMARDTTLRGDLQVALICNYNCERLFYTTSLLDETLFRTFELRALKTVERFLQQRLALDQFWNPMLPVVERMLASEALCETRFSHMAFRFILDALIAASLCSFVWPVEYHRELTTIVAFIYKYEAFLRARLHRIAHDENDSSYVFQDSIIQCKMFLTIYKMTRFYWGYFRLFPETAAETDTGTTIVTERISAFTPDEHAQCDEVDASLTVARELASRFYGTTAGFESFMAFQPAGLELLETLVKA